jgi:thiol-disulfide isomerase/thioredoxin
MVIEALISRMTATGPPSKRPPHIWFAEFSLRLILLLLALLVAGCDRQKAEAPQANEAAASAPGVTGELVKGVDRSHKGEPIPQVEFRDAMSVDMESTTELGELQDGRPMLVNLWATWCAPCVKELPTLEKMRDRHGGAIIVVPVSQDGISQRGIETFLDQHNLDFVAYQDPKMALSGALGVQVMPTTVLYGSDGKEIWRYVGDLDWTGAEAAQLLSEAK